MFINWLTQPTSSVGSSSHLPPDVIIEVGPPPFTRFPAHAKLLAAHSGYLRAAIVRAEESSVVLLENPIYLPNITSEQFTPLLTFMYTGFLDLNSENIFGVLLATHLLHMPRPLEICRSFLARSQQQSEVFFQPFQRNLPSPTTQSAPKIIRPIPSKACNNSGINFISPPNLMTNLLHPSQDTSFRSLVMPPQQAIETNSQEIPESLINMKKSPKIKVIESPAKKQKVEKFDGSEKMDKSQKLVLSQVPRPTKFLPTIETQEDSQKVIIDVASCDGPVRFRRVLNEAYECNKPPAVPTQNHLETSQSKEPKFASLSFHQQMARNITEQIQQQMVQGNQGISEESENSQDLPTNKIYTCIYCNHTFKSQYCYQKHAKRHLNPLYLEKCKDDGGESAGNFNKFYENKVEKGGKNLHITNIFQLNSFLYSNLFELQEFLRTL